MVLIAFVSNSWVQWRNYSEVDRNSSVVSPFSQQKDLEITGQSGIHCYGWGEGGGVGLRHIDWQGCEAVVIGCLIFLH